MPERKKVGVPAEKQVTNNEIDTPISEPKQDDSSARIEELARRLHEYEKKYTEFTRNVEDFAERVNSDLRSFKDSLNKLALKWRDHFGGR